MHGGTQGMSTIRTSLPVESIRYSKEEEAKWQLLHAAQQLGKDDSLREEFFIVPQATFRPVREAAHG